MAETEYKLPYDGPQVAAAIGRALPGGEIDTAISEKADKGPPEESTFPVATGVTNYHAGKCYKSQDGKVLLELWVKLDVQAAANTEIQIGTLLSGWRPKTFFGFGAVSDTGSAIASVAGGVITEAGGVYITSPAAWTFARAAVTFATEGV